MSEEIKTGEKTGIKVEEYKGVYSLVAMNNGYQTWAKFKKNKSEYMEKDWPVKVILGDREAAIAALKQIMDEVDKHADVTYVPFDPHVPF